MNTSFEQGGSDIDFWMWWLSLHIRLRNKASDRLRNWTGFKLRIRFESDWGIRLVSGGRLYDFCPCWLEREMNWWMSTATRVFPLSHTWIYGVTCQATPLHAWQYLTASTPGYGAATLTPHAWGCVTAAPQSTHHATVLPPTHPQL